MQVIYYIIFFSGKTNFRTIKRTPSQAFRISFFNVLYFQYTFRIITLRKSLTAYNTASTYIYIVYYHVVNITLNCK